MNVIVSNEDRRNVTLFEDDGDINNVCSWSRVCPPDSNDCLDCPARNEHELLNHRQAVKWWSEQV